MVHNPGGDCYWEGGTTQTIVIFVDIKWYNHFSGLLSHISVDKLTSRLKATKRDMHRCKYYIHISTG